MKKYWGDTICSECGKEIPYGVRRWCPKCNALDKPRIDEGKLFDSLEFWAYRQGNMLKLNDDDIKKLARAIAQKASEIITFGK